MKSSTLEKEMNDFLDSNNRSTKSVQKPDKKDEEYIKSRDRLMKEYLEKKPFDFNINTDKLYSQYADQYKRQGEAAMRDTMANAAANTGGYTSSYGISAGAQAYQSYLDRLNEIIPTLEQNAYDRYRDDEAKLKDSINTLDSFDSKEYSEYRDDMTDYKDELDYYRKIYEFDNNSDLEMYRLMTDYFLTMSKLENEAEANANDLALKTEELNAKKEADRQNLAFKDKELDAKKEADRDNLAFKDKELEAKKETDRQNLVFKDKELDFEKDKEYYDRSTQEEKDDMLREILNILKYGQ